MSGPNLGNDPTERRTDRKINSRSEGQTNKQGDGSHMRWEAGEGRGATPGSLLAVMGCLL